MAINWIQTTLEKHFKWLFIVLLVVIIVSFVSTVGAVRGLGEPETKLNKNIFYGFDLNNPITVEKLQKGVLLGQLTGATSTYFGMYDAEAQILGRAALLHLADTLHVPLADEATLTAYLKTAVPIFKNKEGAFDAAAYHQFIEWTTNSPEFGAGLTSELMQENFRIGYVAPLLSGVDVLPYEIIYQNQLIKTVWSADLAEINLNSLPVSPAPSAEELKAFYEAHAFRYQVPAQRGLTYVIFETTNFLSQVPTPTTDELKAFYTQHSSAFAKIDDKGKLVPQPFEKVDIKEVQQRYREEKAHHLAAEAAENLTLTLYENNITYKSDAFENLLNQNHLLLNTVAPFSKTAMPTEGPFSSEALSNAFALDNEHYFSDVAVLATGTGLLFLDSEIPARSLTFEEAKSDVLHDYDTDKLRQHFSENTQRISAAIKADTELGKSFTEAAKAQGLTVTSYNEFTLETPPPAIPGPVLMGLPTLGSGGMTPMITLGDTAYILYVHGKIVPQESLATDPELKAQQEPIAKMTQMMATASVIGSLITAGLPREETQLDRE